MISEEQRKTHVLQGTQGRVTAQQAWEHIAPRVHALDPATQLTMVSSGEDIDSDGASSKWEFACLLATQLGHAWYIFEPSDYEDEQAPLLMHEHVKPFITAQRRATMPADTSARLWEMELAQSPPLPLPFRDSAVVVQQFAAQGVDFSAGDTHMVLTGRVLPDQGAVWFLTSYDTTYSVPFQLEDKDLLS